jgi:hypothetical protein
MWKRDVGDGMTKEPTQLIPPGAVTYPQPKQIARTTRKVAHDSLVVETESLPKAVLVERHCPVERHLRELYFEDTVEPLPATFRRTLEELAVSGESAPLRACGLNPLVLVSFRKDELRTGILGVHKAVERGHRFVGRCLERFIEQLPRCGPMHRRVAQTQQCLIQTLRPRACKANPPHVLSGLQRRNRHSAIAGRLRT